MSVVTATRGAAFPHGVSVSSWVAAAIVLAAGIGLAVVLRHLLGRRVRRADSAEVAADMVGRLSAGLVVTVGLLVALAVVHVHPGTLLGALGIGGLAVAFAAQSIIENFFASVVIQIRRPFRRGDQVSVAGVEGTVEGVDFRTVIVRAYDGVRVRVPSGSVLRAPIYNLTAMGRRRTTLDIGVSYDADLDAVQALLLPVVAGVDGVEPKPEPEVWVSGIGPSSIDLAVRFWHRPDYATMWRVRSQVAVAVKAALDGAGVDMPFPQRVVHLPRPPSEAPG